VFASTVVLAIWWFVVSPDQRRSRPVASVAKETPMAGAPAASPAESLTPTSLVLPAPAAAANPSTTADTPSAAALPETLFVLGVADEAKALRALARRWGVYLGNGEPCTVAVQQSLQCFRSSAGLSVVRQLDRPGVLRLQSANGRIAHVLLLGLTENDATLDLDGVRLTIPLMHLTRLWRGDYATLWRAPSTYKPLEAARVDNALGEWLVPRLAQVDGLGAMASGEDALRLRVAAFQTASGLYPDGIAGPLTLMRLSRATGVDEPRLGVRTLPVP
jgi:general secretion pathway protein A